MNIGLRGATVIDSMLAQSVPGAAGSFGTNKALAIDTTPPAPPATPDLQADSDTGPYATDNVTKNNTPTFYIGGVEPNATVTVYANDAVLGTVVVPTGASWVSFTPSSPMSDGSYTIRATQTDLAEIGRAHV